MVPGDSSPVFVCPKVYNPPLAVFRKTEDIMDRVGIRTPPFCLYDDFTVRPQLGESSQFNPPRGNTSCSRLTRTNMTLTDSHRHFCDQSTQVGGINHTSSRIRDSTLELTRPENGWSPHAVKFSRRHGWPSRWRCHVQRGNSAEERKNITCGSLQSLACDSAGS